MKLDEVDSIFKGIIVQEELKKLQNSVKAGSLKVKGVDKETLDQVLTLQKALRGSGMGENEIEKIIAKATGSGLEEPEIASVIAKALQNSNLTEEEKEKLKTIEKNLQSGKLRTQGMKGDAISKLLLISEKLEATGEKQRKNRRNSQQNCEWKFRSRRNARF